MEHMIEMGSSDLTLVRLEGKVTEPSEVNNQY